MAAAGPVLIAGGGIGGLALALALAKAGRDVLVLEQQAAFATAGAGIQLGPNGVKVLERLGVASALAPLAGVPEAIRVRDGRTGAELASLPLGSWLAERHGAPYWTTHRGDLHGALLAAASAEPRIALRTSFALAAFFEGPEAVTVSSASGDTAAGCALVGADGLWSRVRAGVCPSHEPQFAGATATRAVLQAKDAGKLLERTVGLWLTPGVHVVHYPVRGASEVAVVVIAREDWRGREWDAAADLATLRAHLSGFHRSLSDVLAPVADWRKWALHRLGPLPRWAMGRVALMGDAAHPMLPYLAQGGVLALEDALVLGRLLGTHAGEESRAFSLFGAQRRVRAARVQAQSLRQGRLYHLSPPLSWARDAGLRLVPGSWLMAAYGWLYGWRPDAGGGSVR
jgi:salicylate hydroxylase